MEVSPNKGQLKETVMIDTTSIRDTDVAVIPAIAGIDRVIRSGATIGYVHETGGRFVSLYGAVYNTSIEIAQSLDRDTAVDRLLAH